MVTLSIITTFLTVITIVSCGRHDSHAPGYSYAKFSGPVSGPEKEVLVADDGGHGHGGGGGHSGHKVDYVAKPDYHFAYGVEDPKSKVSQSRKESRNGDAVHGEYSVVDPDGVLRIVKYTADKHNGFQAHITVSGGKDSGAGSAGGGGGGGGSTHAHVQQQQQQHDESSNDDDEYY